MIRHYLTSAKDLAPGAWSFLWLMIVLDSPLAAHTLVLANRTGHAVRFTVVTNVGSERSHVIGPADLAAIPVEAPVTIRFAARSIQRSYRVEPDSAYFFHTTDGAELDLGAIGLSGAEDRLSLPRTADASESESPVPAARAAAAPRELLKIPVKLLVDDEERAARARWEDRLRKRLAAASEIFQRHCGVSFWAAAVETWQSQDDVSDFEQSFREFEANVPRGAARICIGFTSQYSLPQGRFHLGGTKGPLGSHILLREWSQHVSEAERLELLVHELGHFLGASHSPERDSVMRPMLGDRQALARSFRIGFDPLNTLALNLVADGLREKDLRGLRQLRPASQRRLVEIYSTLARSLPEDPTSERFLDRLVDRRVVPTLPAKDQTPPVGERVAAIETPLVIDQATIDATRAILAAIVAAAAENVRGELVFRRNDLLTEHYVRIAARAALDQPEPVRNRSFLLALAIAVDTSDLLRRHALTAELLRQLEADQQRTARLSVIGSPTMRQRHDLAQHFFVSAALAHLAGRTLAESLGIAKEVHDAQSGSGFSFADLAADLAGIALAEQMEAGTALLPAFARSFQINEHFPPLVGLRDDLSSADFSRDFGSLSDERFQQAVRSIRQRIDQLYADHE